MNRVICEKPVSEYMNPAMPVVSLRTSIPDALDLVRVHGFSALPVCDEGRFLGMVREKDLLSMTPSKATSLSRYELHALLDKVTVGAVVRSPPATAALDLPLRKAAELMRKTASDVLPVFDQSRFAGLISWMDLLDAALETDRDGKEKT